jgi:hypothetical protein
VVPSRDADAADNESEASEVVDDDDDDDNEAQGAVADAAALELLALFDSAALRFQEQSIAMQLEEAHAAGESMLSAAAIPLEEEPDSIAAMQLDTLQYDLAEATNHVLDCAQVVLEDPDDEDAVEQFTASLRLAQETIVAVRRVLAPWEYEENDGDEGGSKRTDAAYPGQFRVTAADIRKVKLRDKSLRLTTAVASADEVDGDDERRTWRHGQYEAARRVARRCQGRRAVAQGRTAQRGGARVDARAVGRRAADA